MKNRHPSDETAVAIYQTALDEISALLMADDAEGAVDRIFVPASLRTTGSEIIYETREEILEQCQRTCTFLRCQRVTHHIRLVLEARFLTPDRIKGIYTTHTLRNATHVVVPYDSMSIIERRNGGWGFAQIHTTLSNTSFPIISPQAKHRGEGMLPPLEDADARAEDQAAKDIYQDYIDALSQANLDNDFARWCALCHFPHTAHTAAADKVIKNPEGCRPLFDLATEMLRENNATAIPRIAETAAFLSGDQIIGYHLGSICRGDEVIIGPVKSRMIIQRKSDGTWAMTSVTNAIADAENAKGFENPTKDLPTLREIAERSRRFIHGLK